MFFVILLLIPLVVLLIVKFNYSVIRNKGVLKVVKLRFGVLISTFIIIFPSKVMSDICGIFGGCILIAIFTSLAFKTFSSIYAHNSLPSFHSVLFSILVSVLVVVLVYPFLDYYPNILLKIGFMDYKYYAYFISCLSNLILDTFSIDVEGVYMIKRTPELDTKLRSMHDESRHQDYYCNKAFKEYKKELNSAEKVEKLRELFRLVGLRRDICKEIDALSNSKRSSLAAFKEKDYSKFVRNLINSIKKK